MGGESMKTEFGTLATKQEEMLYALLLEQRKMNQLLLELKEAQKNGSKKV